MAEKQTKICPLLAIASIGSSWSCSRIEECCAFWSTADMECAMLSIADAAQDMVNGS